LPQNIKDGVNKADFWETPFGKFYSTSVNNFANQHPQTFSNIQEGLTTADAVGQGASGVLTAYGAFKGAQALIRSK